MQPSAYLCDAGAGERHDHGHHVDGQLELQELGDAVVDVPSPHDGLDDAGEVVVSQDDVRRLLCHVCAGDSLTRSRGGRSDVFRRKLRITSRQLGRASKRSLNILNKYNHGALKQSTELQTGCTGNENWFV